MVVKSKNENYNILLRQQEKNNELLKTVKGELNHLHDLKNKCLATEKRIIDQIESIKRETIVISDHAFIRLLERTGKIDVNKVAETICNKQLKDQVDKLGDGKYPVILKFKDAPSITVFCIIQNKEIITIEV